MSNKRLNAVVTIGGAVAGSLRNSLKSTKTRLTEIGGAIQGVKKRQDLLAKSIDTFGRQGKDVSRMREEYARLTNEMERLRRRQLGLKRIQDADLGGSFRRMRSEIGGVVVKATALGGVAAAGIFGLAKSTAELGDNVAKTADKLGIGIARLQEIRYAAERSGLSVSEVDTSMEQFTRRLSEASQGTGTAVKALDALGLSAAALASMSPDEAMAHVADAMQGVENQTDRVRLAYELFGRSGVKMVNMLKDGSKGLQQLYADAQATGYVLGDKAARDAEVFQDRLLDVSLALKGMKNTLGAELMPVVTRVFERFSGYLRENRSQVQAYAAKFAGLVERAVPALFQLAQSGVQFVTVVASITSKVADLVGGFDNLATIAAVVFSAKAIASVVAFGASIFKVGGALVAMAGGFPAVVGGIKAIGLALMANPIGLIIGGIALAAGLIWKYWEPIKGFMANLWEGVKSVLSSAWEGIKTLFSWHPLGLIIDNWGGISDWFGNLWDGVVESARGAFDWIAGKLAWIGDAWGKVKGWFSSDEGQTAQAGPANGSAVSAAPMPSGAMPSVAQPGGMSIGEIHLHVATRPGEDERALAERLWQLFQQKLAQQQRGALYDTAGAY
jgi:phage-related minor tail protein